MQNHLHFIIYLDESTKSLNYIVSNLKRFWAYEIVKRLEKKSEINLIKFLQSEVVSAEKAKGKIHQVFRLSFDAKECYNEKVFYQKLNYIHSNPVNGKWNLAKTYLEYEYSSASYYDSNSEKPYFLFDFRDFM